MADNMGNNMGDNMAVNKNCEEGVRAEMEKLEIGGDKSCKGEEPQTFSGGIPHSISHSQINSDIQARLVAFQQKRSKPAHGNSPGLIASTFPPEGEKPLPPLPPLSQPNRSRSASNAMDPSSIPSPRDPDGNQPGFPTNISGGVIPQNMRVPNVMRSPKQQPFELLKKPSLSQRRGMKLNLGDVSSPTGEVTNPAGSPVSLPDLDDTGSISAEISRKPSDRRKPNFKLNFNSLNNPSADTQNIMSTSSSASIGSSVSSASGNNAGSDKAGGEQQQDKKPQLQGLFANYSKYVDIKSGSLNFAGKASLHSKGVDFLSGSLFHISLDELEFIEELGHGNYGVVLKVLHKPTGVLMAMKEVRLELDETKFTQILMELEILHKCDSPYVVDFYGAFFVEGAVYMCIEYMDGGSLDKIYGKDEGIKDEACLAYISECIIKGLKELKDKHNIIHRDVKPTNILVNTLGKVKLCDFGVSGNLVASLAKTNIGCQSYMAPERIKTLNPNDATYSVQSDIWSLGLTILEVAAGHYPYPAETYSNIFSQLSAIVDGDPPKLDAELFSRDAQIFVKSCLNKNPDLRPSYATLLNHPWLLKYRDVDPHMDKFVTERAAEYEEEKKRKLSSRSNSMKATNTKATPESQRENVRSLLKNKVRAPALHRGGLMRSNRNLAN